MTWWLASCSVQRTRYSWVSKPPVKLTNEIELDLVQLFQQFNSHKNKTFDCVSMLKYTMEHRASIEFIWFLVHFFWLVMYTLGQIQLSLNYFLGTQIACAMIRNENFFHNTTLPVQPQVKLLCSYSFRYKKTDQLWKSSARCIDSPVSRHVPDMKLTTTTTVNGIQPYASTSWGINILCMKTLV